MKSFTRAAVVAASTTGLVAALAVPAVTASAQEGIRTIATGFAGPLHVAVAPNGDVIVADAFAGAIDRVNTRTGSVTTVVQHQGFTPGVEVKGQQIYYTFSEGADPFAATSTTLRRVTPGGPSKQVANMLAYELAHNPDGQPQNTEDAISNPYSVLALPGRVLVGDAAGNDIVEIRSNGAMRTLTVFPVSFAGECATATNNGVPNGGCDPVPTEIALGPDGFLYVSGLGAEVEGFIWKVNATTGAIVETHRGFPPLTGVAVAGDGTIFAASLFANTVFRLSGGAVSVADVPGPTGLDWGRGVLYAGSANLAGGPGSLLAIGPSAFHPAP